MKTETPETEELIERAGRGDDPARQALLARHRARLRRMVAVRMDDGLAARVDPSDVVQEVLAEAHRTLDAYLRDRPLPFYPWLRRLAWERLAKLYRRHVRSHKRSTLREEAEGPGLPDRVGPGPGGAAGGQRDQPEPPPDAGGDARAGSCRPGGAGGARSRGPGPAVPGGALDGRDGGRPGRRRGGRQVAADAGPGPVPRPAGRREEEWTMTGRRDFKASGSELDPILEQLLDDLIERLQAGEEVDLRGRDPRAPGSRRADPPHDAGAGGPGRLRRDVGPRQRTPSGAGRWTRGSPARVLGDFRLLREIGRGGMGIVYEAEQVSLRPPRGAEGPAVRRGAGPPADPAVPGRGPGRRLPAPPAHRPGARRRLRARRALLRHAAHRGPEPGRDDRRAAPARRPGPGRRPRAGPGRDLDDGPGRPAALRRRGVRPAAGAERRRSSCRPPPRCLPPARAQVARRAG